MNSASVGQLLQAFRAASHEDDDHACFADHGKTCLKLLGDVIDLWSLELCKTSVEPQAVIHKDAPALFTRFVRIPTVAALAGMGAEALTTETKRFSTLAKEVGVLRNTRILVSFLHVCTLRICFCTCCFAKCFA